ncbi:MAG: carbohydrate-binding protein [Lentisphaerae bacterium]|nr:MAG: carbohydrate-binding protein [Lentisphaerota bacterium]
MVMKMFISSVVLATCFAIAGSAEGPVKPSPKRGVCANRMTLEDARALAPGVTWWYNWHHSAPELPGSPLRHIPMIWGKTPKALQIIIDRCTQGKKIPEVLVLNEPNLKGQAFLKPQEAAQFWNQVHQQLAVPFKVRLAGPQFALGSSETDAVKAIDPISGKITTYTFMVPYFDAFLHELPPAAKPDNVGVHSYGNIHELRWLIPMLYKKYRKPIWVTEFNDWKAAGSKGMIEYLIQAVDFLERTPYVERYAWFKARMGKGNKASLLEEDQPGKLTRLGAIYVNMPVHDPDYAIPAERLRRAEDYTQASSQVQPALTEDNDGFLDLCGLAAGAWVQYKLAIPQPTSKLKVTLRLRAVNGSRITLRIMNASQLQPVSIDIPAGHPGYQDVQVELPVNGGIHDLRLAVPGNEIRLNSVRLTCLPTQS